VCIGCAPFMTLLLALPLTSLFIAPASERGGMGMAALAAALFVVHLVSAVRRSVASSRRLEAALKRARRERRRAEAARTEKKDFMGLMSHELRTPLNGVLGMAQAMQIEPLTPEQRDRLEVIRNSGEILRTLLNDVLEAPDFEAGAADESAQPPPVEPGWAEQRLRVLAAEDNPTNQLVLRTLLSQAGIEVHVVGDGEAAVEAWRTAHWDLVLMDIRMPIMDGLAATRAIRAAEAATGRRRTPIIAVSAEATTRAASDSLVAGMDCFVPKPIHFGQLATAMAGAIAAAAAQDDRGTAQG
jgi:CheY-like chemotaxis protein